LGPTDRYDLLNEVVEPGVEPLELTPRLRDRLAHLGGTRAGQRLAMLDHERPEPPQNVLPLGEPAGGPGALRRPRAPHLGDDARSVVLGAVAKHRAGRGVQDLHPLAILLCPRARSQAIAARGERTRQRP